MSASLPSRFPTPLPTDPWAQIVLPALAGEHEAVVHAVDQVVADGVDGDLLAVSARAMFAINLNFRAERLAIAAYQAGGVEADRLTVQHRLDGRARVAGIAARTPHPGARAEVWCDLAGRDLIEGDLGGAREAVEAALRVLPEHCEARHWSRFLADAAQPVACFARAARGLAMLGGTATTDARALVAPARTGFVSSERWARRHGAVGPAPATGSALERLAEAGIPRPRLLPARGLNRRPASDGVVAVELLADEVDALAQEGRTATEGMRELLAEVRRHDPAAQANGVRVCARLASRTEALVPIALDAVDRLLPHDPEAWMPWAALLGAASRPDRSVRFARSILGDPGARPEAVLLAYQALVRCGLGDEASRYSRSAASPAGGSAV